MADGIIGERAAGFDTPWGARRPGPVRRKLIALGHRTSPTWAGARMAFLLRRLARWRVHGPLDVLVWGVKMRLHPTGNITEARLLFMPRHWDIAEREWIRETGGPGIVFVDVGANVGAYGWWVWSLWGDSVRTIALEPDPELVECLRWHVRENGARRWALEAVAAGAEDGEAELFIHGRNRGQNSLLTGDSGRAVGSRTVGMARLATVFRDQEVERVDLLKIDIEGYEEPVLTAFFAEAPRPLWPSRILMEYADSESHRRLRAHLTELGYVVVLETKMNLGLELSADANSPDLGVTAIERSP